MGFGDEIIATGLARGTAKEDKLAAFGAANKIVWSKQSREVFLNNPNIATPEQGSRTNLKWIPHYVGHRLYATEQNGRWIFRDWECPRGEFFFSNEETQFALQCKAKIGWPLVVVEPEVKVFGACVGANKQWPIERYQAVAKYLSQSGYRVAQFVQPGKRKILNDALEIRTPNFRAAAAVLKEVLLYIGPEGGLHHAAAAVGTGAIVLFGGFNSPKATGYKMHENIAVGEPCGSIGRCGHCKEAMESISVDRVIAAAEQCLPAEAIVG